MDDKYGIGAHGDTYLVGRPGRIPFQMASEAEAKTLCALLNELLELRAEAEGKTPSWLEKITSNVVTMRPGDRIALVSPEPLTPERAARLRDQWSKVAPALGKPIVLDAMSLHVLRRENDTDGE